MRPSPSRSEFATKIDEGLFVLSGAVNTGMLLSGDRALLIDCCDSVSPKRLTTLGIHHVDMVLCTQHRRPNVAGAYPFVERGALLLAPLREQHLFEAVDAYWSNPANRWHIYHHQPGPQVLPRPLPVSRAVQEGDVVKWEGHLIRVLDTPGATDGSISYLLETKAATVCFSGDTIYGPGQIWDLCSLQKGQGDIRDYHGFLGNLQHLICSLRMLAGCGADILIPSHGVPIADPDGAIALLLERLDMAWRNYTSISSLNHYFPGFLSDARSDSGRMKPVPVLALPPHVRRVAFTSYAVMSTRGGVLLVDCGDSSVVNTLEEWMRDGLITGVEACWVTHYHDDHIDALGALKRAFGCPIICDSHQQEIIEHPQRFFMPCISPHAAAVDRVTKDGEAWRWREFSLTAFHFPGQTYYGGGLLVEGRGARVFFSGDSGSPTGIDDHCPGNRNFLGIERGFRHCLALWRELKPDMILNQHQDRGFRLTEADLDQLDSVLAERERLFADLLPWPDPNFGADENWVRAYPYEQEVKFGETFWIDVQFTNHGPEAVIAVAEPVTPDGWPWQGDSNSARVHVPPRTDGTIDSRSQNPDGACRLRVRAVGAVPGQYVIPIRITWGSRYLGQYRHAIVRVST